ncbi:uncharacterized protein LOC109846458 isoform X1 [Asparagus officinalis]|uniref:uncharacterized protein LOC109846458 isoform X1 n=1 Tax=Asparagus officinalis TaxID=4686 RepID=UPI00098E0AC0|nr:uncharacterized protein LOC109846458 isoform X1 [Asparagus officinalis]
MMALDNYYLLFSPQPSLHLDWDSHSSGLGREDVHEFNNIKPLESSTGYLQDAVVQWSDRCKRRRLISSTYDAKFTSENIHELLHWQGFWDSSCYGDPLWGLNCLVEDNSNNSDKTDPLNSRDSLGIQNGHHPLRDMELEQQEQEKRRKKKMFVYPFRVLKPIGLEGNVTLADINERILKRPTRPVKHPVGEFAIGPCVSIDRPGLSGKAVVALTRIQTQGRGTITIIRTRG